ncbi:MAG: 5'-nucleotidase C-terminal domain-containing protein, partial [Anaerolineales bacterium]|nr:5'-nucleotidase C-terminal domain-containing protein [Anaerolineales bacterium]
AGDISQGTLYFVQYRQQEGRDFYNMIGYDVIAPGNHEFDLGPKVFADNFVSGAKFPIVLANVDLTNEPTLAGKLPPYVVKEVGGEKIGIFGMILDELVISTNVGPNVKMKDAIATAQAMVAELEKQGVNKIILLSHRGHIVDLALAARVDGIDLIVGGHSHTLLGDSAKLDKSFSAPFGPYPTVVKTPNGGKTLIVQDFEFGRNLGKIDLTFDAQGQVSAYEGAPIFVDSKLADDPDIAKKLADLAKPLDDLRKQVIGKTTVDLEGDARVLRTQEANSGNLVADAMLWATAWDKTQVAITNGGSIRRAVKAGDISYGDVLEVLPFGNRLMEFDLSGADLLAALENGLSLPGGGRFPQVAGLKMIGDWSKPVGARVSSVEIGNAKDGFKPLDKNATYRIVTNDFMANGGDGYATFKNGKNPYGGDVPMDQALTDYLKYLNAPIAPQVEGRIVLTGTPPPAPTAVPTATPTATPTPSPTPKLFPLPMWTPLPIPTFSFEPVLPKFRVPCVGCRPADAPPGGRDPNDRWQ